MCSGPHVTETATDANGQNTGALHLSVIGGSAQRTERAGART